MFVSTQACATKCDRSGLIGGVFGVTRAIQMSGSTPSKRRGPSTSPSIALERVAKKLAVQCESLRFGAPVAFTYNPLVYAWNAHRAFLARAQLRPRVLFVGMNPGPFGMAQTGVPFGEVAAVQNFFGINAKTACICAPELMHPKRPIEGFACTRSEVSGARVWSWAKGQFGTADEFFHEAFIWNWCPLAFMSAAGTNITPDKLPRSGRGSTATRALEVACDEALAAAIRALQPANIVGFGAFAATRARDALARYPSVGSPIPPIHQVLHPSPASPAANRGWAAQVDRQLAAAGIHFGARPILPACVSPSSISSGSLQRSSRGASARTSKHSRSARAESEH